MGYELKAALAKPGTTITFIDTCYFSPYSSKSNNSNSIIGELTKQGSIVFAASWSQHPAHEDPKLGHGIFTYSLLEGLTKGKADMTKDNAIGIKELYTYISNSVVELTGGLQQPTTYYPENTGARDFTIWVCK